MHNDCRNIFFFDADSDTDATADDNDHSNVDSDPDADANTNCDPDADAVRATIADDVTVDAAAVVFAGVNHVVLLLLVLFLQLLILF